MSKFLRDLTKIAEDEGYEYAGYAGAPGRQNKQKGGAGSGHHVFIHRTTGAVQRTASTPKSESNSLKYARANFRNAGKRAESKAVVFRAWVLKRFKVGKNGSKVVEISLPELVEAFNAEHPEFEPLSVDHVGVMVGQDPMFERISSRAVAQHQYVTEIRISGPAYGLTREDAEPEVEVEEQCGETSYNQRDGGVSICTNVKGHSGLHFDKFRNYRWAVSAEMPEPEAEPVIDPVAQAAIASLPKAEAQMQAGIKIVAPTAEEIDAAEAAVKAALAEREVTQTPAPPVLEPVTVGGIALPDTLADQLREALGMPDATIAAANQDLAIRALEGAQDALEVALAAIKGLPAKPKPKRNQGGKDTGFGRVGLARLDEVAAAVKDGRLPERFTTTQVSVAIGLTEGQAVSLLAKAHRLGFMFRRVAMSTYVVR